MPPTDKAAVADAVTDEEMEGLSEEERAALDYEEPGDGDETPKADEDDTSGKDDATPPAAADETPPASDDKGAAEAGKAKDEAAATAGDGEAEGGEGDQEPAGSGEEPKDVQRNDVNKIRDDYQASLNGLNEEIAGLGKLVEDGEMTFAEYHIKNQELNDAKIQARVTFEDDLNWQRAQSTFFAAEDNAVFLDPMRQTFLQATIDQMYKAGEMDGLDYGSAIAKAAAAVRGALNLGADKAAPAPKVEKKPGKPAPTIPQTLGDVPPAEENLIEPNKFAHLDGLNGDDLEVQLAKMSTAEVDAWLESTG